MTTGYAFRRSITIDHTKCGTADQVDFPILVSGTYSYLATVANGGKCFSTSGFDIMFALDPKGMVKLDHEIETYTAASGLINMWVRVPRLSVAADTIIYVFYGNPAISVSQENKPGVWDASFKIVQHLPNGSSLTLTDSTSNANTSTVHGMDASTGQVDGCARSQNDGEYYDAGTAAALGITGALTLECWTNLSSLAATAAVMSRTGAVNTNIPAPYDWQIGTDGADTLVRGNGGSGGSGVSYQVHTSTTGVSTGSFFYVGVTMSGSGASSVAATVTHYKNGASNGSGSISFSGAAANSGSATNVARRGDGGIQLLGKVDEVRISNVDRSASYFTATYNSVSSPSTFYTVGAETVSRVAQLTRRQLRMR